VKRLIAGVLLIGLAACGTGGETSDDNAATEELALSDPVEGGAETLAVEEIEEVGPLTTSGAGVTPMAERVAVLGLLNKRNGISQEIRLRPGESTRLGDVVIRLRACETTAPWEPQRLTGAFVQVFVRGTARGRAEPRWGRVFSGWLFKERPALNVVEHRLYDVWPKACEMTYPESAPSSPSDSGNAASSARRSAPTDAPDAEIEPEPSDDSAESSTDA